MEGAQAEAQAEEAQAEEAQAEAPSEEEGQTFPLDVGSPGADRLRSTVKAKLSEFMGSYTDDVLAEYVVVLVGHGKQQKQATADLEAFLGSQSEAFVSWLWDHLTENLIVYTQASGPVLASVEENQTTEPSAKHDLETRQEPQEVAEAKVKEDVSEPERKELDQHTSTAVKKIKRGNRDEHSSKDGTRQDLKRPRSPEPWSRRGRTRAENKEAKKEISPSKSKPSPAPAKVSPPRLKAPRRLLESALRDAVAPGGSAARRTIDSTYKRLRSVVSTDHENSDALQDSNGKLRVRPTIAKEGSKVSPAMIIALKAAAAAAEDVNSRKASRSLSRFTGSVWDRLGNKTDEELPDHESNEDAEEEIAEKMEYVQADNVPRVSKANERQMRRTAAERLRTPSDAAVPAEAVVPPSHYLNDGHRSNDQLFERCIEEIPESLNKKDATFRRHEYNGRQKKPDESTSVHYRRISDLDMNTRQKDILPLERKNTSQKIDYATRDDINIEHDRCVDIPIGEDQDAQDVTDMKKRMRQVELEMTKLRTRQDEVTKEVKKATTPTSTVAAVPSTAAHAPAAALTTATAAASVAPVVAASSPAAPSSLKPASQSSQEDPDSRMILVTNVHFATTKEAISSHFGPCGDIVKVTLLTDGVSGKPKGSAYVEFSSRDAADRALSLNESCLLSRPLRVVRKDANVAETSSIMRPPIVRPVRMPIRAFPRAAFMRGSPYMLRPPRLVRPPYPVAPHLQWKRDAGGSSTGNQMGPSTAVKNGFRSSVGPIRLKRSLSYVRPAVPPTPPEALATSTEEQKGS